MIFKYLIFLFLANSIPLIPSLALSSNNLNSVLALLNNIDNKSPRKPIVLLLNSDSKPQLPESNEDEENEDEQALMTISKHLRESQKLQDSDADSDTDDSQSLERSFLRAALVARCRKVDKCQKKCNKKPRKKKQCKKTCKEELDEEDACGTKKKNKCSSGSCERR